MNSKTYEGWLEEWSNEMEHAEQKISFDHWLVNKLNEAMDELWYASFDNLDGV